MKIAPRDISSTLARPSPQFLCYFFHGADIGLIRERGLIMAKHIVSDLDDPFQSVLLNGEAIKADPTRLTDEVTSLPVFGDERLVRVRGTGTELLEAVKMAAPALQQGTRLIIEASDTTTRHALVKFCETQKHIASIGCYADDDRDISQLARDIFAKDNITISQEAMSVVIARLGGDRRASVSELEKLALMAGPKGSLSVADIEEALGDSSAQAIDIFMKSVITGDAPLLASMLEKARQEEIAPIAILRQMAQALRQIYEVTAHIDKGESATGALSKLRPPVHFKTKPLISSAASRLSSKAAFTYWQRVVEMEKELKSGTISEPYTHLGQGMLGLCLRLRPRRR